MSEAPYQIYGALGSPYSLKMRAILRYRRLPHVWVTENTARQEALSKVKAPVIPVIKFPDGTYHNDSTPMAYDLEGRHDGRSIIPEDESDAFLARLIEDLAAEWGTKMMFLYRWHLERDQKQMSEWLVFDNLIGTGIDNILGTARHIRERQVGRMALVGCTEENAPLIEKTAGLVQEFFEEHVTGDGAFLFGSRPSIADFAWYGQLSQLAVDPTPQHIMREHFPFTYRWLSLIDDASGVEGEWRDATQDWPMAVKHLLVVAGDVYFPFLKANADAVEAGAETFNFSAYGLPYEQGTFKYQVKCLNELRTAYAALSDGAKKRLNPLLDDTKCLVNLE